MALLTRRKIVQSCPFLIGAATTLVGLSAQAAPRTTPACDDDGPRTPSPDSGPLFQTGVAAAHVASRR